MSALPGKVVGSLHDHNVVPGTQSALNVRAHKERLPFADPWTRLVIGSPAWDLTSSEGRTVRDAARARTAAARARALRTGNVVTLVPRGRHR